MYQILTSFVEDYCASSPEAKTRATVIYTCFMARCAETEDLVSQKIFVLTLKERFTRERKGQYEVLVNFNSTQYILKRHELPDRLASNIKPAARLVQTAMSG